MGSQKYHQPSKRLYVFIETESTNKGIYRTEWWYSKFNIFPLFLTSGTCLPWERQPCCVRRRSTNGCFWCCRVSSSLSLSTAVGMAGIRPWEDLYLPPRLSHLNLHPSLSIPLKEYRSVPPQHSPKHLYVVGRCIRYAVIPLLFDVIEPLLPLSKDQLFPRYFPLLIQWQRSGQCILYSSQSYPSTWLDMCYINQFISREVV